MRLVLHFAGDHPVEVRQGPKALECRVLWEEGEPGPWREVEAVEAAIGKPARFIWKSETSRWKYGDDRRSWRHLDSETVVERIVCSTGEDVVAVAANAS